MIRVIICLLLLTTPCWAMTYTTNFNLEKPEAGDRDWATSWSTDMDSIDSTLITISEDSVQDIWYQVDGDAGSTSANITKDTMTIAGGGISATAVAGDTITITSTEVDDLDAVCQRGNATTKFVQFTNVGVTGFLSADLLSIDNLTIGDNSISSDSGIVSFDDDNIITTGDMTCDTLNYTTLNPAPSDNLDDVCERGNLTDKYAEFAGIGTTGTISGDILEINSITIDDTAITSSTGTVSFDNDNIVTTGQISCDAGSLGIPSALSPDTITVAKIAYDTNDRMLEIDSRSIPTVYDKDFTVYTPSDITHPIPILHVDPDIYPGGISLINVQFTISSDFAYIMSYDEYAGDPPTRQNLIEALATTATDSYIEATAGDIDDRVIAADAYIYVSMDDVGIPQLTWIQGKVIFYVEENE